MIPLIDKVKIEAVKRYPYFSSALFAIGWTETEEVPTACVSMHWQGFYNPKWLGSLNTEQQLFVLIHELSHLIREHFNRIGDRDLERWNIAADKEINAGLLMYLDMPPWCVSSTHLLTAEQHYAQNKPSPQQQGRGQSIPEPGSSATGKAGELEKRLTKKHPNNAISKDKAAGITKKLARDIIAADGENAGSVPADLVKWAVDTNAKKTIDWRSELRVCYSNMMETVKKGSMDRSYRVRHRQAHLYSKMILPGQIDYVPRLGIVFDVSGSMSHKLDQAYTYLRDIVQTAETRYTLHTCDARITQTFKGLIALPPRKVFSGGGGTYLMPGIKQVQADGADICIVLSDGESRWDKVLTDSRLKTILVLVRKEGTNPPQGIPSWFDKVIRVPLQPRQNNQFTIAQLNRAEQSWC